MTTENPGQLDNLLRQWADRQAPSDAEIERLRRRIVQSVVDGPAAGEDPIHRRDEKPVDRRAPVSIRRADPTRRTVRSPKMAAAWFALGASAAALIVVGFSWFAQPDAGRGPSVANETEPPPGYAWLKESQLRDKAVLLREMESIFDRRVAWLLETGEDVKINVVDRPTQTPARPLTVRVLVERRRAGEADGWTIVWAADVVVRSEEVVHLEPDSPTGTNMTLWAYVLPDGMIAVDSDLTLGESSPVTMTTNNLVRDGEPVQAGSAQSGGYEFRLFQTAAVLQEPVL